MKAEALRGELVAELLRFAWDQWAQLGVSAAPPSEPEERAADPEALLLFTLEVAREDPRLFDEVLDWLVTNESVVSVHRLRGLCVDEDDRALVGAALATASRRRQGPPQKGPAPENVRPLFPGLGAPLGGPDARFLQFGLLRAQFRPSNKSRPVPFDAPIAFALRMRQLFGVGVRAEVMRTLLTIRAPRVPGRVIAADAGFARRNVREALLHLQDAGGVQAIERGDERYYSVRYEHWLLALGYENAAQLPFHFDWIPAYRALTRIVRWLRQPDLDGRSPYLRASAARTLVEEIGPDLRTIGLPSLSPSSGDAFWDDFVVIARQASAHVRSPRTSAHG